MPKHLCLELPLCCICTNREKTLQRYHNKKGEAGFLEMLRERDQRRRSHSCPEILPCSGCKQNGQQRKRYREKHGLVLTVYELSMLKDSLLYMPGKYTPKKKRRPLKIPYRKMTIGLLAERDGWICHICSTPITWDNVTIDHIIPKLHGGDNSPSNLALAHKICNMVKGPQRRRPLKP